MYNRAVIKKATTFRKKEKQKIKKSIGIYCITNTINNKKYVGKSVRLEIRINYHKNYLNKNKHPNNHLQFAWNKYKQENFSFEILEECEKEYLNEKEKYYIELFNTKKEGYNYTRGGDGSNGFLHSQETKKKLSEIAKNRIVSSETREKISIIKKGIIFTEEHKRKLSESGKGKHSKPVSDETREKLSKATKGENNPNYGKKMSEEQKKKISETKKSQFLLKRVQEIEKKESENS